MAGFLILVLLLLIPDLSPPTTSDVNVQLLHGRITGLVMDPDGGGQGRASVLVLDGPRAGETMSADLEVSGGQTAPLYRVDEEIVVQVSTGPDRELVAVTDRWRLPLLTWVVGAFALLVLLVGGWRGVRALVSLMLTIGVVVKIVLPLLLAGWTPVPVAVATASGVGIVTLLLTEGLRRSTLAAAIGTLAALALTAGLAAVVTLAAQFTALMGSEDAAYLQGIVGSSIDLNGLFLAAVIFGALAVLDDVTITQAVAVAELAEADPAASPATLVGRAMNVGRAHISATLNTLVLAYVAASLPLLLLFAAGGQEPSIIASTEVVAVEIVRALVGSMGIVAAVPLTTLVAAALVGRRHLSGNPA
jgi:uncharacterized membrane protein